MTSRVRCIVIPLPPLRVVRLGGCVHSVEKKQLIKFLSVQSVEGQVSHTRGSLYRHWSLLSSCGLFSEKFKACILDFRPIQRGGRPQAEIRNLNIEILNKPKQVMNYGRTERRLFRAGSGLAWESERIAGPELGHTTHNIVRFR
jgi:hypothetical protein